jgi:predicted helicase
LITHTSTKPVRKQGIMGQTTELGLQNFLEMSPEQWEQIAGICAENAPQPPPKRKPPPFQETAIAEAVTHFQTRDNARGKLIMPCGTGKSLMAYWMASEMNAKSIILAVPSLALVKQSLGDWTAEFLAEGVRPEWLAVCSDDSVGSMKEADSMVSTVYEAGIPATTDQLEIIEFLEKTTDVPKVIFTTYQSGNVLAEACTAAGFTADLLIADEAHKTVGSSAKKFATLLSDDNTLINKRLFMTATERVIRGSSEGEVVSMDDVSVYGEVFHQMTFAEAIAEDIICDYKILTLFVSESKTADLVSQRQAVEVQRGNRKVETDAHSLAVGLAVEKAFKKYGIKRAITFHSSIKKAENFVAQQRELSGLVDEGIEIDYQTISSKQTAGQRSKHLHDFKSKDLALLSNARCLTEGVDIPSIDCVAFVDPKQSVVDIVQAAGRAMRQSKETGKEFGYILLPISLPSDSSFEDYVCSSNFKALKRVIAALASQDERIVEELQPRTASNISERFIVDADYEVALHLKMNDFIDKIRTELWVQLASSNWHPYEKARDFVRKKEFKKWDEFLAWTKSDERLAARIPSNPALTYGEQFISISDWLGTPQRRGHFLPFPEARAYVQGQKLKSQEEYSVWAKTEKRPENIPADPRSKYLESGWNGWGDWLGTGTVANYRIDYLPFNQAREYARSLSLSSGEEWIKFIDEQCTPENVPRYSSSVYSKNGWNGMKDWLGTAYLPLC